MFDDTTPTGGDMGAHVWGPAYLRDHLLPSWQLSGWSMDWYAGMPDYRFYMVVPALLIVALDTVLPYGVAFKLVAVLGLVTLPVCCWAFGRLARFRYPMPELFALRRPGFVLDESFSIYGGNLKWTMAGEFSFSIALSLGDARARACSPAGLRDRQVPQSGRRSCSPLAMLCHGIVLIFVVLGASIMLCSCGSIARGSSTRVTVGSRRCCCSRVLGRAVPAQPRLHDRHEVRRAARQGASDSFWDMFFPLTAPLDILITTLAVIGFVACVVRRHLNGIGARHDRPRRRRRAST